LLEWNENLQNMRSSSRIDWIFLRHVRIDVLMVNNLLIYRVYVTMQKTLWTAFQKRIFTLISKLSWLNLKHTIELSNDDSISTRQKKFSPLQVLTSMCGLILWLIKHILERNCPRWAKKIERDLWHSHKKELKIYKVSE
jgi:hypothetical protein